MESHIMNGSQYKCYSCLEKASHSVKLIKTTHTAVEDSVLIDFLMKVCNHCGYSSYATRSYQVFTEGEDSIKLYPTSEEIAEKELNQRFDLSYFDESVKNLFKQIIQAYTNDSLVLATVGLRVLLEEYIRTVGEIDYYDIEVKSNSTDSGTNKTLIENDNLKSVLASDSQLEFISAERKNLKTRINGLFKERHINKHHLFALQKIRIHGNDAAHEAKEISKEMFMVMFESIYQIFHTKKLIEHDYAIEEFLS